MEHFIKIVRKIGPVGSDSGSQIDKSQLRIQVYFLYFHDMFKAVSYLLKNQRDIQFIRYRNLVSFRFIPW